MSNKRRSAAAEASAIRKRRNDELSGAVVILLRPDGSLEHGYTSSAKSMPTVERINAAVLDLFAGRGIRTTELTDADRRINCATIAPDAALAIVTGRTS